MNNSVGSFSQAQKQIVILATIISAAKSVFLIQQFAVECCEMAYVIVGQQIIKTVGGLITDDLQVFKIRAGKCGFISV